ncbi:MAG: hypothetical protein LIO90_06625 [Bacteroidales bacterium]|nr:hypothetical protein [Bacteroidales bacterium]
MEINEIISQLQSKFGNGFNISKVTEVLKGSDHSNLSIHEIISKLTDKGLLGDIDGDGVQESLVDELKGKASQMFGNLFGGK